MYNYIISFRQNKINKNDKRTYKYTINWYISTSLIYIIDTYIIDIYKIDMYNYH